jgi:hypothetical protein
LADSVSGTPQYVAYLLMRDLLPAAEGPPDRAAVLDLYAECLLATTGRRGPSPEDRLMNLAGDEPE